MREAEDGSVKQEWGRWRGMREAEDGSVKQEWQMWKGTKGNMEA